MDQHVHRSDVMPLWCIWKVGKQHLVGRNVYQTVSFRIIEMMVVRCVGIENAVLVMNSDLSLIHI